MSVIERALFGSGENRNYWWPHCSNPESCLEPLLALWRGRRAGGSPAAAPEEA